MLELVTPPAGELESVEFVGDEQLRLTGFHVARHVVTGMQHHRTYPPPETPEFGDLVAGEGAVIPVDRGIGGGHALVLGVEVTEPGRWVRDALLITYRVGEQRYTAKFPAQLVVCTPDFAESSEDCPFPGDAGAPD